MNYSVIIFCFNEEGNIRRVFEQAGLTLQKLSTDYEIIIVNDGSTDQTGNICRQLAAENSNTRLIEHHTNKGIGMALKSGYSMAVNEYVCAIPGDGQFDINELTQVKLFSNDVYYSFYRPQTNYSFYRRCLTWLNRLFNQHMLGVYLRDVNWIKVYRLEQLKKVRPELESSLIESEICSKLYKLRILPIEIPSVYRERSSGVAKGGNWKTLRLAIADMTALWWKVTTFKPEQ